VNLADVVEDSRGTVLDDGALAPGVSQFLDDVDDFVSDAVPLVVVDDGAGAEIVGRVPVPVTTRPMRSVTDDCAAGVVSDSTSSAVCAWPLSLRRTPAVLSSMSGCRHGPDDLVLTKASRCTCRVTAEDPRRR